MPNRKLREYGAPVGAPKVIDEGRPKVGPADPATRRKALNEALAAVEAPPPKPKATPSQNSERMSVALDQAAHTLKTRRKKQLSDLGE